MRMIFSLLIALPLAACDSGKVTLDSAIKKAKDGDFDAAISQYQDLIENDPSNPLYYNNLGWALFRNGQFKNAKEQVQKAADFDSEEKFSDVISANSRMITEYDSARNIICVDLSDKKQIAYFESKEKFEVQFRYSANEVGYLLLAECYQSINEPEKAGLAYQQLLALYKDKNFESTLKSKASSMLKEG